MAIRTVVMKYDLTGDLVWGNFYGKVQNHGQEAWSEFSRANTIAAIPLAGNAHGLLLGMEARVLGTGLGVYCMRLNSNGTVYDQHAFGSTDPATPAGASTMLVYAARAVEHDGDQHLALSGGMVQNGIVRAFMWHFPDVVAAPYAVDPAMNMTTEHPSVGQHHIDNAVQFSTDVAFAERQGELMIVWPVLSNYAYNTPYKPNAVAELLVHGLPVTDPNLGWTTDLGEVRAYDLRAGITATSDGGIAIVSSRWAPGYDLDNLFCYNNVATQTQNCLQAGFGSVDWAGNGPDPGCGSGLFRYWNTDAYVSKLRADDGHIIWQTEFDAEPAEASGCFPEDMRKQECMYRIVEAEDGGLVICGNTSHNFDDAYLAKLGPECQKSIAFEPLPLTDGVYELPTDEDWTTDRNILGTIVVPDGKTLTISSNATIRFADSEQLATRTRLIVKPGGRLITSENATLTSIETCPNSMWDGIQLHGDEDLPQGTGDTDLDQAYMFSKNTTIKNARVGVLVANDFRVSQLLGKINNLRSGGIIEAETSTFENNVYDVAFSPYENFEPGDPTDILTNRSHFNLCEFKTTGPLADPMESPRDHAFLAMVRGISFKGCQWTGSMLNNNYVRADQLGIGIRSVSSTFHVGTYCSNPPTTYGAPCEPEYETTCSFTHLHRGILANTFDLSRTFWVDRADFNWNHYGIRMEGIQDATVTRNTFKVQQPVLPGILGNLYGIYSDQCTGYTLQENSFTAQSMEGANKKIGLIIKDSGPQYNTFYNNSFDKLYAGTIIQGLNAADDPAQVGEPGEFVEGLEVKCNDFGVEAANTYDVALTGSYVTIQKTQGSAILNPLDPEELKNPAGNRFSTTHNGTGEPEEDWYVFDDTNGATYFHHIPATGDRTKPDYRDNSLALTSVFVTWPGKGVACPSQLPGGKSKSALRSASGEAHEGYSESAEEYVATKDDGATASLLGYVSDPAHSSTQVRNALQSVAPNASVEVFKAAFQRNPNLAAAHMAQALISNSPLHPEVFALMAEYGLPAVYVSAVESAQVGGANLLSILESTMAKYSGEKAEALYELGTTTWLDSLDLGGSLDSLRLWHQSLATGNGTLEVSAVLTAQQEYDLLEQLALVQEQASSTPVLYGVIKRHAAAEQTGSWTEPPPTELSWLRTAGAHRTQIGSAHANAWLHALGQELPEEIIVLPEEGPKARRLNACQWAEETTATGSLVLLPNPAELVTYILLPEISEDGVVALQVFDATGRTMFSMNTQTTGPLLEVPLEGWASGIYTVELRDHVGHAHVAKLMVR